MQFFPVEEEAIHHVGDAQCPECLEEYPESCVCGGLIHAENGGPDDEDENPGLRTRCGQCRRFYLLGRLEQPAYRPGQPPQQFFPVAILPAYIGEAVGAAIVATVLAAYLPSRRAARLNPVDVMR